MKNNILTNLLRDVIKSNGLVDSGKLLKSTTVYVLQKKDGIYIDIRTTDYFIYLIKDYNIINEFTNNNIFIKQIENIYENLINLYIENLFNNENNIQTNITDNIIILINGK